jgi:hypothetical protein
MQDASTWLFQLGENRPRHTAVLTQDILDRTGPPPLPAHPGAGSAAALFVVEQVVPLLAEDNYRRARLRADRLEAAFASGFEIDDARAEARFWDSVAKWVKSWTADEAAHGGRMCRRFIGRIPAPRGSRA